jgi:hypothetical protein
MKYNQNQDSIRLKNYLKIKFSINIMGAFSSLIDISSFFVGILINLLLIAMICYYFKRKIDNLEVSQSEQAKMLYGIISQQQQIESQKFDVHSSSPSLIGEQSVSVLSGLNLSQLENTIVEDEPRVVDMTENDNDSVEEDISDDESDECDDECSEVETEIDDVEEPEQVVENTKSISYDVSSDVGKVYEYDKMTVRELKEVLGNKGHHNIKSNIKKQDLIDILVREDNKEPEPTFIKSEDSETHEPYTNEAEVEPEAEAEPSLMDSSVDEVIDVENNDELLE